MVEVFPDLSDESEICCWPVEVPYRRARRDEYPRRPTKAPRHATSRLIPVHLLRMRPATPPLRNNRAHNALFPRRLWHTSRKSASIGRVLYRARHVEQAVCGKPRFGRLRCGWKARNWDGKPSRTGLRPWNSGFSWPRTSSRQTTPAQRVRHVGVRLFLPQPETDFHGHIGRAGPPVTCHDTFAPGSPPSNLERVVRYLARDMQPPIAGIVQSRPLCIPLRHESGICPDRMPPINPARSGCNRSERESVGPAYTGL